MTEDPDTEDVEEGRWEVRDNPRMHCFTIGPTPVGPAYVSYIEEHVFGEPHVIDPDEAFPRAVVHYAPPGGEPETDHPAPPKDEAREWAHRIANSVNAHTGTEHEHAYWLARDAYKDPAALIALPLDQDPPWDEYEGPTGEVSEAEARRLASQVGSGDTPTITPRPCPECDADAFHEVADRFRRMALRMGLDPTKHEHPITKYL